MNRDHVKLFIPGPVEVSLASYEAMSAPMIGHRSKDFADLYADIQPGLQKLMGTTGPVFLSTSSAWGVMEASIRNLVNKKVLNCCCGAFSDKWFNVSERCGKKAEALSFEWGEAVDPDRIDTRLASGEFDTVTVVHNETSTGVMNDVAAIGEVVSKHPDVCLVVDTVSSFSGVPTPLEEWGADVVLAGTQKALALPPGLAVFGVSEKALARAGDVDDRGYYFDFLEFLKNHEKNMTPSTPCIALIYGLQAKLNDIAGEGLEKRYARHERLNQMVSDWVVSNGFELLAPEGNRSVTLVCAKNNREIDISKWNSVLQENHQLCINGGYGKLKGKTFRISTMGDETEETITELLSALDATLPKVVG